MERAIAEPNRDVARAILVGSRCDVHVALACRAAVAEGDSRCWQQSGVGRGSHRERRTTDESAVDVGHSELNTIECSVFVGGLCTDFGECGSIIRRRDTESEGLNDRSGTIGQRHDDGCAARLIECGCKAKRTTLSCATN